MTDIIQATPIALPEARTPITIRPGTLEDLPFVDALMKRHSKQLAFLPTKALEGKVALGHVLVAEATGVASGQWSVAREDKRVVSGQWPVASENAGAGLSSHSPLTTSHSVPVGYLIGNDRYKSRDELGVIYQLCVVPEYRRMLVAAHLLKAQFERSAYGCRLYCCWCAQDLVESNRFYESMGFVPIAFRAGSEKRGRVHIFWQKRIREGDTTTPWWFPSVTSGGMMDAARIALPIPPGMGWGDELPRLVPSEGFANCDLRIANEAMPISDFRLPNEMNHEDTKCAKIAKGGTKGGAKKRAEGVSNVQSEIGNRQSAIPGKLWFGSPKPVIEEKAKSKPVKPKRVKTVDPTLATRARELRDRWCERASEVGMLASGKYETARVIESTTDTKRLAA